MNQSVPFKGGHMEEDWVCFNCKEEIDRVRENCAFDAKSGKRIHVVSCPISYTEEGYESSTRVNIETMNQVFSTD